MIANSVITLLTADSALLTALGGPKIFFQRVPSTTTMPWAVIQMIGGGSRNVITQKYTDEKSPLLIYVDDNQMIRGNTIINMIRTLLDNYRGNLSDSMDVKLKCSPIRTIDGFAGSFRYLFDVESLYKETTTYPV